MIAGLVLAGGRSRRMGTDKALVALGGVTLVARAVARLRPQVSVLSVSSNAVVPYPALDAPLLPDPLPGFQGPLAGIFAGLLWARAVDPAITRLVTVAVDTPFFPTDLVARLASAGPGDGVALARSAGRDHPTFALLPVSLADDLAAFLAVDPSRRVRDWLARHDPVAVDFPVPEGADPFFNVNAPEDLAVAEARLGCAAPGLGES